MSGQNFVPQTKQTIQLQIICPNPPPTECGGLAANRFGLQDKKGVLDIGTTQADGSRLFTCTVEVKLSEDILDFSGAVVQGTKGSRFLYLSWAYDAGSWARRIKIPLSTITPKQIQIGSVLQTVIEDGRTSGAVKPKDGWKMV